MSDSWEEEVIKEMDASGFKAVLVARKTTEIGLK